MTGRDARLVSQRVAWLIAEHAATPGRIVVLTTTRRSALVIRSLLQRKPQTTGVFAGTIPDFGHRLLQEQARPLSQSRSLRVMDGKALRLIMGRVLRELGLPSTPASIAHTLQAVSRWKQGAGEASPSAWAPSQLEEIRARYDRALRSRRVLDGDDLVGQPVALLRDHPMVLAVYRDRIRFVLVHEDRPLTRAESEFVHLLAGDHGQLCVIRAQGPSQSGSGVICFQAQDEDEEADVIVSEIKRLRSQGPRSPRDIAILCSTWAQALPVERALLLKGLPFSRDGTRPLFSRAEEDVHAYLRLILDPDDDAAFARALVTPPRGVTPGTLASLRQLAGSLKLSLYATVPRAAMLSRLPARTRGTLSQFRTLVQRWRRPDEGFQGGVLLNRVLQESGYLAYLHRKRETAQLEQIERLLKLAGDGDSASGAAAAEALISRLRPALPKAEGDTTITLAELLAEGQGAAFDIVFLPGMVEGLLPSWRALEDPIVMKEEHRLFELGRMRARRRVYLSYPLMRTVEGNLVACHPSRFLDAPVLSTVRRSAAGSPATAG